jgi:hypothetical protein
VGIEDAGHSFGRDCLGPCSEPPRYDGDGKRVLALCVHVRYGARWIAFRAYPLHREAYEAYEFDPGAAASHELARLAAEFRTLPLRGNHRCTCRPRDCPYYSTRDGECIECRKLHDERKDKPCPKHGLSNLHPDCPDCRRDDVGTEIGRTQLVNAPTPPVDNLDEAFAESRGFGTPAGMAAFLNGERGE